MQGLVGPSVAYAITLHFYAFLEKQGTQLVYKYKCTKSKEASRPARLPIAKDENADSSTYTGITNADTVLFLTRPNLEN